ncbi:DUF4339 domain-containing protein [Thermostilla marina]
MGIRFYCPNGHKLHVKAFQAGKRGICPYCGEKVLIPLKSTRRSTKELKALRARAESAQPTSSPRREAPKGLPPKLDEEAFLQGTDTGSTDDAPVRSAPTPLFAASAPAGTPSATPPVRSDADTAPPFISGEEEAPLPDPIAEDPSAVWYVRPPSGGQYGPAEGDIFARWIDEGRVTPDSLVWREGWRNWKEAREVFPQLQEERVSIVADAPLPIGKRPSKARDAAATGSRQKKTLQLSWILTGLIVALFLSGGILAYLLWG